MKRIAILAAGALLSAQAATAAANWQVTTFAAEPQNLAKIIAATDKLMSSAVGKTIPGSVSIMQAVIDGNDPATHSFISAFDSMAEREAWFTKLVADPAWSTFLAAFTPISDPGSTSRMNFVKSWGEQAPEDVVWHIHTFAVADGPAFVAALDTLMASATGKKFPGQLHLSAVAAAGSTDITHTISVGYTSETEAESWGEVMSATPEWAAFLDASGKASDFGGTFIIRTVKTWGGAE